jgi:hypothetical protein
MKKKFTFTHDDFIAWVKNALWFTSPVILIYITSVIGIIQQPEHIITLADFIPNNLTIIGMVYWVLNRITDYLRRFTAGKT